MTKLAFWIVGAVPLAGMLGIYLYSRRRPRWPKLKRVK
jgi:hypothetical protein